MTLTCLVFLKPVFFISVCFSIEFYIQQHKYSGLFLHTYSLVARYLWWDEMENWKHQGCFNSKRDLLSHICLRKTCCSKRVWSVQQICCQIIDWQRNSVSCTTQIFKKSMVFSHSLWTDCWWSEWPSVKWRFAVEWCSSAQDTLNMLKALLKKSKCQLMLNINKNNSFRGHQTCKCNDQC